MPAFTNNDQNFHTADTKKALFVLHESSITKTSIKDIFIAKFLGY